MAEAQVIRYGGANIPPEDVAAVCADCDNQILGLPSTYIGPPPPMSTPVTGTLIPLPTNTANQFNVPGWDDVGDWILDAAGNWVKKKISNFTNPTTPSGPSTSSKCPDGQIGLPPACFDLVPGGGTSGGGMYIGYGEAVMGRYGAAIQPAVRPQQVSRCPRGSVLGNDGLCYNSRDLRRADRKWVPGRKPLLTGGDLNAIARASRAANKMKTQQKRLQKLGLLPKPTSSRRGARPTMIGRGSAGALIVNQE